MPSGPKIRGSGRCLGSTPFTIQIMLWLTPRYPATPGVSNGGVKELFKRQRPFHPPKEDREQVFWKRPTVPRKTPSPCWNLMTNYNQSLPQKSSHLLSVLRHFFPRCCSQPLLEHPRVLHLSAPWMGFRPPEHEKGLASAPLAL